MSKLNTIYFDRFEEEYVLEKELLTPPERYMPIHRSETNDYVELWRVDKTNSDELNPTVEVRLSMEEYTNYYMAQNIRDCLAAAENYVPLYVVEYSVPSDVFDYYVKHYITSQ